MFYLFKQNDMGGNYIVNDTICHKLIIESDNLLDAINKATSLGVYWNGVAKGIDRPGWGDRWSITLPMEIHIDKYAKEGFVVDKLGWMAQEWSNYYSSKYIILEHPKNVSYVSSLKTFATGKLLFYTIEEYARYMANEYGQTNPAIRIFYKDGRVAEFTKILG